MLMIFQALRNFITLKPIVDEQLLKERPSLDTLGALTQWGEIIYKIRLL